MLTKDYKTLPKGKQKKVSGSMVLILVFINIIILKFAYLGDERLYLLLALSLPLLLASAIYYNYPKWFVLNRKPVNQGVLDDKTLKEEKLIFSCN